MFIQFFLYKIFFNDFSEINILLIYHSKVKLHFGYYNTPQFCLCTGHFQKEGGENQFLRKNPIACGLINDSKQSILGDFIVRTTNTPIDGEKQRFNGET